MKRSIDTSIWGDPWFNELSANGKMVFMYLLTNERSTAAGIFDLSPRRMAFDIGIDQSTAESALEECAGRVRWWPEHNIVWVMNFFRHQAVNDNFLKSAQRTFADLPNQIRQEVVMTYPEFDMNPSGTHPEPVPMGTQTPTHIAKSEELTASSDQEVVVSGERAADAAQPEPKPKRKSQCPDDFEVTDQLEAWGASQNPPFSVSAMRVEVPQFVDYYRGKGETRADWYRSFQTWMRNSRKFERGSPSRSSPQKYSGRITSVDELFAQGANDEPAGDTENSRDSAASVATEWSGQDGDSSMDVSSRRHGFRVIASGSG